MNNKLKTFFDILPILSSIILFFIISIGLFVYVSPVVYRTLIVLLLISWVIVITKPID